LHPAVALLLLMCCYIDAPVGLHQQMLIGRHTQPIARPAPKLDHKTCYTRT
jgi:hypothetical protein